MIYFKAGSHILLKIVPPMIRFFWTNFTNSSSINKWRISNHCKMNKVGRTDTCNWSLLFFSIISLPWKKHFTQWQFEIIFQYRCRIIKSWSWSGGESTILYVVYTDINHLTFSFSHKPLLTKNETITYNTQLRIFEKYKLFEKRHLCV